MSDLSEKLAAIAARAAEDRKAVNGAGWIGEDTCVDDKEFLLALVRDQAAKLAKVETDIDGELQDAPPPNYEEDNYDAGYIAGLTYAQDLLRAALEATP